MSGPDRYYSQYTGQQIEEALGRILQATAGQAEANVFLLPDDDLNVNDLSINGHEIPAGGSVGYYLKIGAGGDLEWAEGTDTSALRMFPLACWAAGIYSMTNNPLGNVALDAARELFTPANVASNGKMDFRFFGYILRAKAPVKFGMKLVRLSNGDEEGVIDYTDLDWTNVSGRSGRYTVVSGWESVDLSGYAVGALNEEWLVQPFVNLEGNGSFELTSLKMLVRPTI